MEKIKFVYGHDPITFEFIGAVVAHLCPVTKAEYLIPANAVETAPLKYKPGFAQIWRDNKWIEVTDERGKDIYDCSTGEKVGYVNKLFGDIKEGQTTLIPEMGKVWKINKWVDAPLPTKKQIAMIELRRLEAQITARRIREALLGVDSGWLVNQERMIAEERKKL